MAIRAFAIEDEQRLRLRIRISHPPRGEQRVISLWSQDETTHEEPAMVRKTTKRNAHFLIPLSPQTMIVANTLPAADASPIMGEVFRLDKQQNAWEINGVRVGRRREFSPGAIGGRNIIFDIVLVPASRA